MGVEQGGSVGVGYVSTCLGSPGWGGLGLWSVRGLPSALTSSGPCLAMEALGKFASAKTGG